MRKVTCPKNRYGYKAWCWATDEHPYMTIKYNSRPKAHQTHVKILKYIAEHPGCRRRDVVEYIKPHDKISVRGYMSTLFSNLLWHDFIDYDKDYCYTITTAGLKRLAEVE
jgi:hypothetical protein